MGRPTSASPAWSCSSLAWRLRVRFCCVQGCRRLVAQYWLAATGWRRCHGRAPFLPAFQSTCICSNQACCQGCQHVVSLTRFHVAPSPNLPQPCTCSSRSRDWRATARPCLYQRRPCQRLASLCNQMPCRSMSTTMQSCDGRPAMHGGGRCTCMPAGVGMCRPLGGTMRAHVLDVLERHVNALSRARTGHVGACNRPHWSCRSCRG